MTDLYDTSAWAALTSAVCGFSFLCAFVRYLVRRLGGTRGDERS